MKPNHKFIDSPEFDEFFRRGDEAHHSSDTLQPVVDMGRDDDDCASLRTPAQLERRAKFIKLVSVTMAFLTVGSAGAFAYRAAHGHHQPAISSFAALPAADVDSPPSLPAAEMPVRPVSPVANQSVLPSTVVEQSAVKPPVIEPPVIEPPVIEPPSTGPAPIAAPSMPSRATTSEAQNRTKLTELATPPANAVATKSPLAAATPKLPASKPAAAPAAEQVSTSVAAPASGRIQAKPVRPKQNSVAKGLAPKPDGYRPPTASFSD